MSEKPFIGENKPNIVEAKNELVVSEAKNIKLEEGVSTGWEDEIRFNEVMIKAVVGELDVEKKEALQVTERVVNHEGIIVSLTLRAKGSLTGYTFDLKGSHGPRYGSAVTAISRDSYAGADSDKITYSENIADCIAGGWTKK